MLLSQLYYSIQDQIKCLDQQFFIEEYYSSPETTQCQDTCEGDRMFWYKQQISDTTNYAQICKNVPDCDYIKPYIYLVNGTNECVQDCLALNKVIYKNPFGTCIDSCYEVSPELYTQYKNLTCMENCDIYMFSSYETQRYPWFYKQNTQEKYCSLRYPCPPQSDDEYIKSLKYLLEDVNQCQEKECSQVNGTQYISNGAIEDGFLCKINNLCKKSGYFYPDKYIEDYIYCNDTCDQHVWYYYQVGSTKYQICDTQNAEMACPPTKPDGDEYNYVNDLNILTDNMQCVAKCSESKNYYYTTIDGQCAENCGENAWSTIDTEWVCRNSTQCDITKIPPEYQAQNKRCIQCEEDKKFIYNNQCQSKCYQVAQKWYINYQDQSCVAGCDGNVWSVTDYGFQCRNSKHCTYEENGIKEYLVEDNMQCLKEEDACNIPNKRFEYYKDDIKHACIPKYCQQMDQYQYYQDKYDERETNCNQQCTNVWYYYIIEQTEINKRVKICDTQSTDCPPTLNQGNEYEYTKQLLKITTDNQCTSTCILADNPYYVSDQNSSKCVTQCDNNKVWSYENNDQQCRDQFQCDFNNGEYFQDMDEQCIKKDKACLQNYMYKYQKDDNQQICSVDSCSLDTFVYLNKYTINQPECAETCDGIVYQYPLQINGQESFALVCNEQKYDCPPIKPEGGSYDVVETFTKLYQQRYQMCVSNCKNQASYFMINMMVSSDGKNICQQSCKGIWYQDNNENYCTEESSCPPTKYQMYTKKTQNGKCVTSCRNEELFNKYSQTQNGCYQTCPQGMWRLIDNENQCIESQDQQCDLSTEYLVQDTYQCIGQNEECPSEGQQVYIKVEQNHSCILNDCYNYKYYENQYDSQQTQCLDQCNGISFQQQINQSTTVLICRSDEVSCPPDVLQGDDREQISKLQYLANNQCVEECPTEIYYYPSLQLQNQCMNDCDDYGLYSLQVLLFNQQYIYCSESTMCNSISQYPKIQPTQQHYQYIGVVNTYYCVSQCQNDVWYQYNNEQQCLEQCSDGTTSFSLNMETKECAKITQQQCNQIYHVELGYRNSSCQYIEGAQNCQYYNQYEQSVYQLEQTMLCVSCTENNKFISYDNQQCISSCGQNNIDESYVWYYDNQLSKNICTQQVVCPPNDQLTNLKYLLEDTNQCQEKECQSVDGNKYSQKQDNQYICIVNKLCKDGNYYYIDQYYKGQKQYCLEYCNNVWYYYPEETEQNMICDTKNTQQQCPPTKPEGDQYNYLSQLIVKRQNQCVELCQNQETNKITNVDGICSETCGDNPDQYSIDISTLQCGEQSYNECIEQYHIEIEQYNTKCQYIKGTESCQQFESYGGYIYQMKDNKLCTKCEEEGYKIDNNICKLQDIDEEKQKLSGGAIAGIVIGCIVVIAVIVIISIIVIKKKQNGKQGNNEVESREMKVAARE